MQAEAEQLLSKFSRFLAFLSTNGPSVFQGTTAKLNIALQFPQVALAKFNLLLKELCHKSPASLDGIRTYANNKQLFLNDITSNTQTKQQGFMVVMDLVCSTDIFNLQASDIEPYKASFVAWLSDVVNQENIHKLFCYVAMFDELVDHSFCSQFGTKSRDFRTKNR